MNDKPELLGKMIKERREHMNEKKMTQEELAEKVGVSAKQISSYENGHQYPPMDMLFKLCEVLDCDLGYLLGQEDYKDGTLLRTRIVNATGLTSESLRTIIGIKNCMEGTYLPALNKLLSDKSALLNILIPLTRLEKLEQVKAARGEALVNKYGDEMIAEAMRREPDRAIPPDDPDAPEIDEKLLKVMGELDEYIDENYDIDRIDIPVARYEMFESLVALINSLYPNNTIKLSFR